MIFIRAIAVLCIMEVPEAPAQINLTVPLHFSDAYGHSHTITFGIDSRATYGFDGDLDEMPVPPAPSAFAFDVRLTDPDGRKQYPFEGAYKDFRPYLLPSQIDTFHVRFQPAGSYYPVTVAWSRDFTMDFQQVTMIVSDGEREQRLDMKKEHRVKIDAGNHLMIITQGPRQKIVGGFD